MGLVLLGAAAAEAQTSRILVSNTAVANDDTANTSGNDHAQLFHTGTHADDYILTGVRVNSEDDEGDDFDVEVCEEDGSADEFPSTTASDCTALTAPSDFTAGLVFFTHAGLALSANTNYVVVIKQRGTGSVRLKSTTNIGEDTSLGLSGWSIKNKFYWKSGSTWMIKSGSNEALRIVVSGYEGVPVVMPPPVVTTGTEIWAATLTAEENLTGTFVNEVGYDQAGPRGSLDDDDFDLAGTSYTVTGLKIQVPSNTNQLLLTLDTDPGTLVADLTLHIGTDTFPLADATTSTSGGGYSFLWTGHGLSWSNNDMISVSLTSTYDPPPTLSALALSGVTLSPAFDADTETYTASVANSVATTTVTAMATDDAGATVAVTPSTDADAVTSGHQVNLGVGPTTITATVTAEDGMTTKTYTVVVTRAAQTCTVPTGGIWGACLTAATILTGPSTGDASLPATGLGCSSTNCGDTSVLTSRNFSFGGKNYRIDAVDLRGGTLVLNLQTGIGNVVTADQFSSVVLHVGTLSYSFASASFLGNSEAFFWTNTGLSWSANDKVALQLVEIASTNAPPAFSAATATRSVPENSPASTNVGAPVTATDGDNDPLAYSLEGTAATAFEIVSTSGQIRTTAGETYDRETQSSYAVTVKADDGNGGTDTIAVTITLTNVIEPPGRPAAPSVSSVADSTTSLSVMWTAPENTGPAIDTYDLRYRQGTSGSWINSPQNVSGTSATISGLTANTLYQVQVLATSGEGGSPWSPSGSGQTNTAGNTAPTFSSPTASRSVPENSAAGTNVGAPVTATDADSGDTLTYTLDGTDAASFDIVSTSGQIQTRSGVTYDYETKSSYAVIVKAADGNGGSDTIMVTITVTDVDESPSPGPEPVPTPALPLLGHLLLALGLTAAGARVIRRRPRVPPAA